jgi:hypothetical protein
MFAGIDTYTMLSGHMHNVPCCIYFLMITPPGKIEWFLNIWVGRRLISIVPWEEDNRYEWALNIDLEPLGKFGEIAVLPFPWDEEGTPSVDEGVFAWRIFASEE